MLPTHLNWLFHQLYLFNLFALFTDLLIFLNMSWINCLKTLIFFFFHDKSIKIYPLGFSLKHKFFKQRIKIRIIITSIKRLVPRESYWFLLGSCWRNTGGGGGLVIEYGTINAELWKLIILQKIVDNDLQIALFIHSNY